MSLSSGDEVPRIFTRKSRLQPGEFLITSAKRLLQHNLSEATVYRLLKDHGLITSPAFVLMKAADRFANPTTAPNQLWQDRLHLSEGHRLGLVLSVHRAR